MRSTRAKLSTLAITIVFTLCAMMFLVSQDAYALGGAKTINITKAKISSTSFIYDGSAKSPKVVSVNNILVPVVKEGYDFTLDVTDADNNPVDEAINAGSYKLVITGIGKYSGTVTRAFTIKKANNVIKTDLSSAKAYVGKSELSVVASANENAVINCKITKGKTCGTLREENGVYYIQPTKVGEMILFFTCEETANYKAVPQKTVKINVVDALDITENGVVKVSKAVWTGEENLQPEVVVSYGLKTYVAGEDYDVVYTPVDNNENGQYGDPGDAVQVTVTAKGDKCVGEVVKSVVVQKAKQSVSFSKKPKVVKRGKATKAFAITADYEDAEIKSVKSTKYAKIKKTDDGKYVIIGKKAGHALITVKTAETEHYAATTVTFLVTVKK